jgi:hypothetical protein
MPRLIADRYGQEVSSLLAETNTPPGRDGLATGRKLADRKSGRPPGEEELSKSIDTICDRLRIQLHGIDRRLEALKSADMAISEKSRRAVESQADAVQQRIFDRRRAVENANANVNAWVNSKRAGFNAEVDEWKERRQVHHLNSRADYAEEYAVAAFELVMAAADEASSAALEALLARSDANVAALPDARGA